MLDKIKKALEKKLNTKKSTTKKSTAKIQDPVKKKRATKKAPINPDKLAATKAGEPWVQVPSMEINKDDPGQGAFELDWNDIFVARLIKAGYQGKTDQDIVDNWFQTVCRNIVLETYQQEQADPEIRRTNNRRDLGDGRTEIS